MVLGNWTATCKRIKLDYFLTLCTKINLKWVKDLNVRPETIKLLEENISSMLLDISLSNFFFLHISPQARERKANITIWDNVKLKKLLHSKGNYEQHKKLAYGRGEDICK